MLCYVMLCYIMLYYIILYYIILYYIILYYIIFIIMYSVIDALTQYTEIRKKNIFFLCFNGVASSHSSNYLEQSVL